MTQSKKIAVTGGIGSGKSFVCTLLREYGYAVFSCDEISRTLWRNAEYCAALGKLFPDCTENGRISKELLSKKVFSDRGALARLNDFSHPRIMRTLIGEMEKAGGISFAEVPLLFEGGYENLFDEVIAVRRDASARIAAVSARDGLSPEEVTARMREQFPPERLSEKNCHIIENNGDREALSRQLGIILKQILPQSS